MIDIYRIGAICGIISLMIMSAIFVWFMIHHVKYNGEGDS